MSNTPTAAAPAVRPRKSARGWCGFAALLLLAQPWYCAAANLVTNGDFSAGNSGFTTQEDWWNTSRCLTSTFGRLGQGNCYDVATNPQADQPLFAQMGDHTSGAGNMMIVNGGTTGNGNSVGTTAQDVVVWSQGPIAVLQNTTYYFSVFATQLSALTYQAGVPSTMYLDINGSDSGSFGLGLTNVGTPWQRYYMRWNSGSATSAVLSVVNRINGTNRGNFALDDIEFDTTDPGTNNIAVGSLGGSATLNVTCASGACAIGSSGTLSPAPAGFPPAGNTPLTDPVFTVVTPSTPGQPVTYQLILPFIIAGPGVTIWKDGPTPDNPTPHFYNIIPDIVNPFTPPGTLVQWTITTGGLGDDNCCGPPAGVDALVIDPFVVALADTVRIDGACGSANGQAARIAPVNPNLCSAGIPSVVAGSGPWNWTCGGLNGGTTSSCSASVAAAAAAPAATATAPMLGGAAGLALIAALALGAIAAFARRRTSEG
ncbi:MAG: hypothetical protein QM741_10960 [Rudaea sp.]|uniref:hypothetical protein n=1 Tax=Rudaea sp. TaxID=2136325 RepID=UPI0039E65C8A